MPALLTVGHSTLLLEQFMLLIEDAGVEAVADVRRYPRSRRHPHFSRDALAESLADRGIGYEHMPELGGRREPRPDSLNMGWSQAGFRGYADHLRSAEFAAGLERLRGLAMRARTAAMCAEAMWWRCHRRLIADVLVLEGWPVTHVLPDGRLVGHELPDFAVRGEDGLPLYPGRQSSLWGPERGG